MAPSARTSASRTSSAATSTTQPPTAPGGAPGSPPADPAPDPARWVSLAVLVVGMFMAMVDITIVNVALPSVRSDLSASGAGLELVVSGYTVAYAVLLVTGARLGDLLGAKTMFLGGLLGFTAASLACGLAPTTTALVLARFAQGVGAAAMVPQILSVIQQQFAGAERARALSIYGLTIALGAVVGQVLGGVLVSADLAGSSWRPAFLVNVPVGLVLALLVPRFVPTVVPRRGRRLDLPGLATSAVGVLLVVLPLVLGREEGWPLWAFAMIAAGLATLAVFVAVERRTAAAGGDPLLDLAVLRPPGLVGGIAALGTGMLAYGGFLFATSLHLQGALGDSALRCGLTFVPAAATFGGLGYVWRSLPASWHSLLPVVGLPLAGLGYLLTAGTLHGGGQDLRLLVPVMLVTGAGMGLAFSPLLSQSLVGVPRERAADASGVLATSIQLAQVLGVTLLGGRYLDVARDGGGSGAAVSQVLVAAAAVTVLGGVGAAVVARTLRRKPSLSPSG